MPRSCVSRHVRQDLRLAFSADQRVKLQQFPLSSLSNSVKQGMSSKECRNGISSYQNPVNYAADAVLIYPEPLASDYGNCGRLKVTQRFLFLHWRQSLIVCVWNQTIFVNCFDQKGCRSNPSCLCFLGDPRNPSPLLPPLSPVMAPLQTKYSVHSSTVFLASIRSVRDFLPLQKPDKRSTFLIAYKHLTSNAYKETMACGNFK